MGKKKSKTESTATYGYVPHQGTKDEDAYRQSIQNVDFHTPILQAFGQAENDVNNSVFEEALPEGAAERVRYGRMFDLRQRKGAALSDAASREHAFKTGQAANLANMTQNRFVQTGGTSYGQQWGGAGQDFLSSFGAGAGSALGA